MPGLQGYTNTGPEPIQNLQINGATLAFTTFVSGLCDPPDLATPISSISSILAPGGTGFVIYRVKVD